MSRVNTHMFKLKCGGRCLQLGALAVGLLWASGCGPGKGKVDDSRFTALGKVMAQQTTQLCPAKGSVVLVAQVGHATPAGGGGGHPQPTC